MEDRRQLNDDFEIIADDGTISVNREHLSNHCEFFKEMFANGRIGSEQARYEIRGYHTVIAQLCLQFMQTGKVDLCEETVVDVLRLSHLWRLTDAIRQCESFLISNLNPSNCVQYVNLARMCDIERLKLIGLRYINENISSVEDVHDLAHEILRDLITRLGQSQEKVTIAWNAVKSRMLQRKDIETNPCELIGEFPVECLSVKTFDSSVLKDEHILSCAACRDIVIQRRNMHLKFNPADIYHENCFKMKELATKYGARHVILLIDRFISFNFRKVCLQEDFILLVTEEQLLTYIHGIDRSCTVKEFDQILDWMKHTEGRHSIFLKFFPDVSTPVSVFQQSLRDLINFIHCDNCSYVLGLTEIYSYESFTHEVDSFIQRNFPAVANSQSVKSMSAQSMTRYASTETICQLEGGRCIWSALINWMTGRNNNEGDDEFGNIFDAMLLENFDLPLLTEISQNELVRNCNRCCNKLAAVTFWRIMRIEESLHVNSKQTTIIATRVQSHNTKWQNQENISRRNDDGRMSFLEVAMPILLCIVVAVSIKTSNSVNVCQNEIDSLRNLSLEIRQIVTEESRQVHNLSLELQTVSQRLDVAFSSLRSLSVKLDDLIRSHVTVANAVQDMLEEIKRIDDSESYYPYFRTVIDIFKRILSVAYPSLFHSHDHLLLDGQ